jgi:hypothetical protein
LFAVSATKVVGIRKIAIQEASNHAPCVDFV